MKFLSRVDQITTAESTEKAGRQFAESLNWCCLKVWWHKKLRVKRRRVSVVFDKLRDTEAIQWNSRTSQPPPPPPPWAAPTTSCPAWTGSQQAYPPRWAAAPPWSETSTGSSWPGSTWRFEQRAPSLLLEPPRLPSASQPCPPGSPPPRPTTAEQAAPPPTTLSLRGELCSKTLLEVIPAVPSLQLLASLTRPTTAIPVTKVSPPVHCWYLPWVNQYLW